MRLSSIAAVGGDGLGPWGVSDEVQKGWETRIPLAMSPYLENGEAPCPWVSLWSLRERESGRRGWVTHIHLSSLSLETPGHLLPASQSSLQTLPPEETGFIFENCLCWVSLVAQTVKHLPAVQGGPRFNPWVGKIPWRRKWQPTPVLLPGKFHGLRRLVGYSPWGRKEPDTTEWLHFFFHVDCLGILFSS